MAKPQYVKLSKGYYGPFEVLQWIGPVAHHLRLSEGSRIHNVFRVSLLCEFVAGIGDVDGVKLPAEFVGYRPVSRPVSFMDERVV